MGKFINVGNQGFKRATNQRYVDKTMLISDINHTLDSSMCMSCVTRCRRFGKSMAADMLCAYYDKSCDSRELFHGLAVEKDPSFALHLNKYPVIYFSVSDFISHYKHNPKIVEKIEEDLTKELIEVYPEAKANKSGGLMNTLLKISEVTGERFFMIIDEWDAITREFDEGEGVMAEYVNFLRGLFKSVNTSKVFIGAYMTGILPIPKDKTQSALNNFHQYTMVNPGRWAQYFGFTKSEVVDLCHSGNPNFEELEKWYDGYQIGDEPSIFNPNSVIEATYRQRCDNYWSATGAFETVSQYIRMNLEGLKDDIVNMLAGGECPVDIGKFTNDPQCIKSKDDALTLLIHLGYLAYKPKEKVCYIPNLEVREEMRRAAEDSNWTEVTKAIENSEAMLRAVLQGDSKAVASGLEIVHQDEVKILSYNDENSLACALNLAFFTTRNHYSIIREMPAGKGFADLIFLPHRDEDLPALVIELKYNRNAKTALTQIRKKQYPNVLKDHTDNILLVGINYNPKTKKHSCRIEKLNHC